MSESPSLFSTASPADGTAPGLQPGTAPSAGMMLVALFGSFSRPEALDLDDTLDAFELFHDHAVGMGWVDDRHPQDSVHSSPMSRSGLWMMNDAGWESSSAPAGSHLASWFQVEAMPIPNDRPLPAQPFIHCARCATSRAGDFELAKVRISLPAVPALTDSPRKPSTPVPSLLSESWFAAGKPADRAFVRISISAAGGQVDREALTALGPFWAGLEQGTFALKKSFSSGHAEAYHSGLEEMQWRSFFWAAPDEHGQVLEGYLAEWTDECIGWIAGALADCFVHIGGRSALLVTVLKP